MATTIADRDRSKIHNNRGAALLMEGKTAAARDEIEAAVSLDPHNVVALTNLAFALDVEGLHDQAIVLYQKAIGLRPGYAVARNNLSRTFATARSIRSRMSPFMPTVWAVH